MKIGPVAGALMGAASLLCALTSTAQQPPLLHQLLDVLGSGDQTAYEQFAREAYAPAALAETPPDEQAAALARAYAETGGFTIDKIVTQGSDLVQAEAHDRIAGLRYCLTLKHSQTGGQTKIVEFTRQGLFPAGPSLTDPTANEVVKTVGNFAGAFANRGLFSGVVLIAKGDAVIFEKAYGPASLAYDRPVTLGTRLNVASIGKSLTGTAIAQLVEAKKLSYGDVVGKFLPDYRVKDVRDNVTIRQLLSHTSGLGPDDYYQLPGWAAARPTLRSVADYLKLVGATPRGGKPGAYNYSNSGYVLLGAIIERVTGQTFYDYIAQHIFAPAAMTRSFYHQMDAEDAGVATPLTNLFPKGEHYIFRLGPPRSAIYELAARGGSAGWCVYDGGGFVRVRARPPHRQIDRPCNVPANAHAAKSVRRWCARAVRRRA